MVPTKNFHGTFLRKCMEPILGFPPIYPLECSQKQLRYGPTAFLNFCTQIHTSKRLCFVEGLFMLRYSKQLINSILGITHTIKLFQLHSCLIILNIVNDRYTLQQSVVVYLPKVNGTFGAPLHNWLLEMQGQCAPELGSLILDPFRWEGGMQYRKSHLSTQCVMNA